MEIVRCTQKIEQNTKSTCKEIKEKIITLERTIGYLQDKRNELMKNKKLEKPPAGLPPGRRRSINNSSNINWESSLRN
tara:strand:+ start:1311 stop:1544 length:234 start_codon:yes stop_codon:yes gene_type:complete